MEDLVGKFVNSAKTTTTTAGAAAKKGTDLVKSINPRPQQTEVASTEASQGMASIILGAIGYQQTRREETAGEGSDTSEAIDGETSSNQEVINETAEVMNNDDIPESPLPVNNGDNQTENSVIDKMKTEYVDIKNISDPAQRKTMFEQFFTPNDDKETTLKKANLILNDLKKNSAPNKIIKDALEAFLKNPSNDKDVLKEQCNLADSSVLKEIFNEDDKQIIIDLLNKSSDNNDTFKIQCDLANSSVWSNRLNVYDKKIITDLLSKPSDDQKALKYQCILARSSVRQEIFNEDDKQIIIDLLNKSSDNNDTFKIQCDLANSSVWSNRLNVYDKKIITDLLSKPSDDQKALKYQCILARSSVLNKIFNEDDKNIITDLLQTPSEDNHTLKAQCDLAQTAVTKGILKAEDKDIITKFLQTPSDNYNTFKAQCNLAKIAFENQTLNEDDPIFQKLFSPSVDKNIRNAQYNVITNKLSDNSTFVKVAIKAFLKNPSDDKDVLKEQCDLAQTAVKENKLNVDDKEIITNLLKNPSTDPATLHAQCDLAQTAVKENKLNVDDKEIITNLLKNPSTDPATLHVQCNLANSSVCHEIFNEDNKVIITNLLKNPSKDLNTLHVQYNLAQTAVKKNTLNVDDKQIITKLLENPSSKNDVLIQQCYLAEVAVRKKLLNKEDKKIITKFLQTPSEDSDIFRAQCYLAEAIKANDEIFQKLFSPSENSEIILTQKSFMHDMLNNKINADSDDSQKAFAKAALLKFLAKDDNMNDKFFIQLTQTAVTKGILKAEDKEIITKFLQTPSNNNDTFKAQYDLAKAAIKNGIMEPEKCEEILDKVKNLILEQKITVAKNLPYLTNDQLKSINEVMLLQDTENENKQFKLEYFLDLKISRGLYDNWYDLAKTLINYSTTLTPDNNAEEHDDGVYNLAVIALKQMPLDKRNEILSFICQETNNSHLQGLLTNDNKCDNETLLTIRPVLKQYKNKAVHDWYTKIPHDYRIPRTTDKCEVFEESGQRYLGYQGTNQRIKTDLSHKQIEYLFGEQRPNGNQQEVGICWLISELKEFNYDPKLKLFIMSRFSMDKNGDVLITLKNNNKVTFPKDIVEKATITVNDEHLSPAMACLSLLAALNRTRKNDITDIDKDGIFNQNITANEAYLKQQFKKENTYILRKTSNESLKPLTDSQDPISYALRKYNYAGWTYNDLLSLFFDEAQNPDSNKENFIIKSTLGTYRHGWSHYDDKLAANPQHSNTLFKKENVLPNDPSDASRKDVFGIDTHYYVPKIDIKKQEFYR